MYLSPKPGTRQHRETNTWFQHLVLIAFFAVPLLAGAQVCPTNIDFEQGNFAGWICSTGRTAAIGTQNEITLTSGFGPVDNRHTLYTSAMHTGITDPYGGFPVLCPNGSGYSIKLGNNQGGGEAEGISYEFTIPANENAYSLIYHYAVVFQSPNHRPNEQPRMEIEVMNLTDNKIIECASFTFIAEGTSLPGFQASVVADTTAVLYKDWSAVTVDLAGNAGKTIRMTFKTADCTFRRHFGYAYIDVDSECSGTFVGATYCADDTAVNITAPFGYQTYTWYDSSLTRKLGNQQVLHMAPPPPPGTTLAVKLEPFDGYGCPNTMFSVLQDTLTVTSNAGPDKLSCNAQQVQIGTTAKNGWQYLWAPANGLSNAHIANPMAFPQNTTQYVVTTFNSGGGCRTNDTVIVRASYLDTALRLAGKTQYCIGYGDSALLSVTAGPTVQWYRNNTVLPGAITNNLRITSQGTYYAQLTNTDGCSLPTRRQYFNIERAIPGTRYPDVFALVNVPLPLKARDFGETFRWNPATFLNNPASITPVFTGQADRLFTIAITTAAGCLTVDTQMVKTIPGVEMYVPTAFTPNNDGRNDNLHPVVKGIKQIRYFRVFNRWGVMLHQSNKDWPGWDGRLNGVPQASQTVVWVLECVGLDDKVYLQKGTTVLLR